MTVKDNHPLLRKKIGRFFKIPTLFVTHDLDGPHVGQVWRMTRPTKRRDKRHTETVYGQAQPAGVRLALRLLSLVRGHWQIDTKGHWVQDVTFGEGHSQVRRGGIPQVMAAIRNACIGLMRAADHSNIAAACRFHTVQPRTALALLGIPGIE